MSDSGFKNVAIVGMGLMGGSLGKALLKYCSDVHVTGIVRREEQLSEVPNEYAAHTCTLNIEEGVKHADLIVLALPVETICMYGEKIAPYIKETCVVTDMGSTKEKIVRVLSEKLRDKTQFIGSHPMAGSEKTGLHNAIPNLFRNTRCIITPTGLSDQSNVQKLELFWQSVGCSVLKMSPGKHDVLISAISHIPHLVAASLVNVAGIIEDQSVSALELAGSGFRDTTRIASGSPHMWQDICLTNKRNIFEQLDLVKNQIEILQEAIKREDNKTITEFLDKAKKLRDNL